MIRDLPNKHIERLFINPPRARTDEFADILDFNNDLLHSRCRRREVLVPRELSTCGEDVWLFNDELNQIIYFDRGTDGWLLTMLMFSNDRVSDELVGLCTAYNQGGDIASVERKRRYWDTIIKASQRVPQRYFCTKRGLKIGDNVEEAISLYGAPHPANIMNAYA